MLWRILKNVVNSSIFLKFFSNEEKKNILFEVTKVTYHANQFSHAINDVIIISREKYKKGNDLLIRKLNQIKVNIGFGIYLEKIIYNRILFLRNLFIVLKVSMAINETESIWINFKQKQQWIPCNRENKFKCLSRIV